MGIVVFVLVQQMFSFWLCFGDCDTRGNREFVFFVHRFTWVNKQDRVRVHACWDGGRPCPSANSRGFRLFSENRRHTTIHVALGTMLCPPIQRLIVVWACLAIKQQAIYCSALRTRAFCCTLRFSLPPSLWSGRWFCGFSLNWGHTLPFCGKVCAATSPKLLGFVSLRAAITFANISSDPARAAPQLVVPGRWVRLR